MSEINWSAVETTYDKAVLLNTVYEDEMDEIDNDLDLENYCREKINEHFPNTSDEEVEDILDEIFSFLTPLDDDEDEDDEEYYVSGDDQLTHDEE